MSHHRGYPTGGRTSDDTANHRSRSSGKTVVTDDGPLAIAVPRDRAGTFEPQPIPKHARRFTGFDDKVIAPMYPVVFFDALRVKMRDSLVPWFSSSLVQKL